MTFWKDNHEAGVNFWRISIAVCWHTDVLEIFPVIRLWHGYIEGIFERETGIDLAWIVFGVSINIK